ncbi:MAG: HNH endonuclease [Bacteroidetes bacterium]|nr:HNH endonuclease [Bacteroidota bacterium]
MRCIEKGASPRQYKDYHDARNDLAGRIGWYCAYCEMRVTNMIEVEHVHPVNHGGNELDWNNFLLSCRYCNGIKTDRNTSRRGYLWRLISTIRFMPSIILKSRSSSLHTICILRSVLKLKQRST